MVTVRTALANSYNIPAVAALQNATLPQYLELMRRLGVTTLNRPDFGLSLSLGAGEIPLIELTDAFAALANGGVRVPPVTIQKITDSAGQRHLRAEHRPPLPGRHRPAGDQPG